jgi:membrane protease YdiL (CAAX protease family)
VSPRTATIQLAIFVLGIVVIGLAGSALISPWIELSAWKVFRRCVSIAAAAMLVLLARHNGWSPSTLGLRPWSQAKGHILAGALVGLVTPALLLAAYLAAGVCQVSVHPDTARILRTTLGFLPAAGIVAVLEEVVFRGLLFRLFLAWSTPFAFFASSAAYAAVHFRPHAHWVHNVYELTGLFVLGVVLAFCAWRTRQLSFAIGLHAALAYWARVNKFFFTFGAEAPRWLVGDNRLINGAVAWGALILVAVLVHVGSRRLGAADTQGRIA